MIWFCWYANDKNQFTCPFWIFFHITMHSPFGFVYCSDENIDGRVHWFLSFALHQNTQSLTSNHNLHTCGQLYAQSLKQSDLTGKRIMRNNKSQFRMFYYIFYLTSWLTRILSFMISWPCTQSLMYLLWWTEWWFIAYTTLVRFLLCEFLRTAVQNYISY